LGEGNDFQTDLQDGLYGKREENIMAIAKCAKSSDSVQIRSGSTKMRQF